MITTVGGSPAIPCDGRKSRIDWVNECGPRSERHEREHEVKLRRYVEVFSRAGCGHGLPGRMSVGADGIHLPTD